MHCYTPKRVHCYTPERVHCYTPERVHCYTPESPAAPPVPPQVFVHEVLGRGEHGAGLPEHTASGLAPLSPALRKWQLGRGPAGLAGAGPAGPGGLDGTGLSQLLAACQVGALGGRAHACLPAAGYACQRQQPWRCAIIAV